MTKQQHQQLVELDKVPDSVDNLRRWLHQQMTEMSALLGIPTPELLLYEINKKEADEILLDTTTHSLLNERPC
jgi:hypothetical protein